MNFVPELLSLQKWRDASWWRQQGSLYSPCYCNTRMAISITSM